MFVYTIQDAVKIVAIGMCVLAVCIIGFFSLLAIIYKIFINIKKKWRSRRYGK